MIHTSEISQADIKYSDRYLVELKDSVAMKLYKNGNLYEIAYHRMDTSAKVLGWIAHLSEKQSVTPAHIRAFIDAAERHGAKVDYNA